MRRAGDAGADVKMGTYLFGVRGTKTSQVRVRASDGLKDGTPFLFENCYELLRYIAMHSMHSR